MKTAEKQLKEVCEDHGLDDVEVLERHDLLIKAMYLTGFTDEPEKKGENDGTMA